MTITQEYGEILIRLSKDEARRLEYDDAWEKLQESIRRATEYLESIQ